MITAKNYAAQAEKALLLLSEKLHYEFSTLFTITADEIKKCVKFAIEDGGRIFDDEWKGLENTILSLPFEYMSLEYWTDVSQKKEIDGLQKSSRTCLVAYQDDSHIYIKTVSFFDSAKSWDMSPCCTIIDRHWDKRLKIINGKKHIPLKVIPFVEGIDVNRFYSNSSNSAQAMLEFLEALSCRNVEISTYQEASPKNSQRIKSHKLPFYETKFLTIKASSTKASTGDGTGTHASPRQHLRRGHIRRLEKGNIWVNSCVVGNKENGVIDKQYKVVK